MKKHRKIILKDGTLQNLRNFLRGILFEAQNKKILDLRTKLEKFNDIIAETGDIPEEVFELENRKQEIRRAFNESICICSICQNIDKDMVYATRPKEWFCIDCYENRLSENLKETWEPKYPVSKDQILEFLDKLKEVSDQCKTNLDLSKQILTDMGIDKTNQKKFLDTLYQYGGHCDCEIIMNAYPSILADFDIEID